MLEETRRRPGDRGRFSVSCPGGKETENRPLSPQDCLLQDKMEVLILWQNLQQEVIT